MTNPNDPNWQQPYPGGHGADPYGHGADPYGHGVHPYGHGADPYGGQYPASQYPSQYGPGSPQYGPPPNPYVYPGYGQQPPQGTNSLALASLITSAAGLMLCTIACPVGAILGHMALGRIKQTGESGRGLALGGIIIGWVGTALLVLVTIFVIASINGAVSTIESDLFEPT